MSSSSSDSSPIMILSSGFNSGINFGLNSGLDSSFDTWP